jgi:hypothetical protein
MAITDENKKLVPLRFGSVSSSQKVKFSVSAFYSVGLNLKKDYENIIWEIILQVYVYYFL